MRYVLHGEEGFEKFCSFELIGGLFAGLFGGGAAAATTAGAVGGAVGGASGLSALSGLGTVFSAVATIGSGIAANNAAKAEAAQQEFAAKDEFIEGKETSAALRLELARTVANQSVAFAAGGVDLGSVSVEQAARQATADAEKELSIGSNQALSRSMARRRAAANARARGKAALFSSVFNAGAGLASAAFGAE